MVTPWHTSLGVSAEWVSGHQNLSWVNVWLGSDESLAVGSVRACGVWVLGHLAVQGMAFSRQGHPSHHSSLELVPWQGSSEGQCALPVCRQGSALQGGLSKRLFPFRHEIYPRTPRRAGGGEGSPVTKPISGVTVGSSVLSPAEHLFMEAQADTRPGWNRERSVNIRDHI